MKESSAIQSKNDDREKLSRRTFLAVGWGGLLAAGFASCASLLRFIVPNVLNEPPTAFKLGKPGDYPVDSEVWDDKHKVFLFRKTDGFCALSAVCTHLGCTVMREKKKDRFYCPCHGSYFNKIGIPTEGPAPRQLEWLRVDLSDDGRLVVDSAKKVDETYRLPVKS